ncbi:MAG TPA: FAD-binding oxidoreductase, partial [Lacipirellula sp.]
METRREFLAQTAGAGASLALPSAAVQVWANNEAGVWVNDVQSQLNATRVHRIVKPTSLDEIESALSAAAREGRAVCAAGGRHAMGGQQFAADAVLLDMKQFNRVLRFDRDQGTIDVEAGIEWPALVDYLHREQAGDPRAWAIREKQSGVDRVSLGGSLAANIHGRGLQFPPIVGDVESFLLVDAEGRAQTCSRRENPELFTLAIGGYGLFGLIAEVRLRLTRRMKVERVVEIIPVKDLIDRVDERIRHGFVYGDCQYSTNLESDAASHPGVFSCYRPVDDATPLTDDRRGLSAQHWQELYRLARTDKQQAFEKYSKYYLSTNGQVYWSDKHQLAGNFDAYRQAVDLRSGTEVITEVYVPRAAFVELMSCCREDFVKHDVDMTYGTIRFIEKDEDTFLPWAVERSVCIICNLHVAHTAAGKAKAAEDFRRIIDRAIELGGRYYLTYHRWASRKQVEACYPQIVEFLRL